MYYPGLLNHPGREVHEKQSSGYGAVISFDVGSGERAKQVLNHVKSPLVAVSLGAVESILSYPAMMSHATMGEKVRHERGITDGLLRFSVGLEDVDDLIADLDRAFPPVTNGLRESKERYLKICQIIEFGILSRTGCRF